MCEDDYAVQYVDYPPRGYTRGWYITAPDYEEIIKGPFANQSDAEAELHDFLGELEGPDPMEGVEFPFARNH